MSKQSEINALISLLDDEDPEIFEHVSQKLISFGPSIISDLEDAWSESFNPHLHEIIENLIHTINFTSVYEDLNSWIKDEYATLFDGALIIARYHFPDLDEKQVKLDFNQIKQKIWLELNNGYTPLENINIFNQVFYGILGFDGNYKSKSETANYCINAVIERKYGNSISLGILYILLAQELELPVYGVNLYKHFILAYQKSFIFDYDIDNSADTIFYLNPMNKGVPFQRREIKDYLKASKVEEKEKYFLPASPKQVIEELLFYLQHHFISKNETEKVQEILKLKELFS